MESVIQTSCKWNVYLVNRLADAYYGGYITLPYTNKWIIGKHDAQNAADINFYYTITCAIQK